MSLIITRRSHEGFTVGDDIHIKILQIRGGQARIAISAPPEVVILRDELIDREYDDDADN